MIIALLPTLLFALTAVFAAQSSRILGPAKGNFARLLLAAVILGGWFLISGTQFPGRAVGWFVLAGSIGFGLGGWMMFQSLPRVGATLGLLIVECASAVWATVMGCLFLNASLSAGQYLFAGISIVGVVIGLFPKKMPDVSKRTLVVGALFAVVASLGQAISFVISKQGFIVLKQLDVMASPVSASFYRLLGGLSVALIIWLILGLSKQSKKAPQESATGTFKSGWVWVLFNTVCGPVLGVTAMLWAIREVGNPGLVQSVVASATLLSVPLSRWTESQKLSWNYYLGAVISIAGTSALILYS